MILSSSYIGDLEKWAELFIFPEQYGSNYFEKNFARVPISSYKGQLKCFFAAHFSSSKVLLVSDSLQGLFTNNNSLP